MQIPKTQFLLKLAMLAHKIDAGEGELSETERAIERWSTGEEMRVGGEIPCSRDICVPMCVCVRSTFLALSPHTHGASFQTEG